MKLIKENNRYQLTERYTVNIDEYTALFEKQSLSRVWKHEKDGFILMSAFYTGNSEKENMKAHDNLKKRLKSLKLGFWVVDGVYQYEDGTTENELSVFIPYRDIYTAEEFKDIAKKLLKEFKQECVLYKEPKENGGKALLIFRNKEDMIGTNVGYDKIATAYTRLKKNSHKGKSFVIEGVRIPSNHLSAMSLKDQGIIF